MANKMLIDAAHPEETRVVVLRGNRVEEFDHESLNRRQLRGNIYLAKVTRVEPSLQAAFVDFGGNRHGFLAFSEIHPDYYQIPVADRLALLEEEAAEASRAEAEEAADDEDTDDDAPSGDNGDEIVDVEENGDDQAPPQDIALTSENTDPRITSDDIATSETEEPDATENVAADAVAAEETVEASSASADEEQNLDNESEDNEADATSSSLFTDAFPSNAEGAAKSKAKKDLPESDDEEDDLSADDSDVDDVESVGSEDVMEEVPDRVRRRRRTYKIQEVIKRRQIILVQVVKEERGNKGAALTTYLSLAGRYTVLMPNTARGGGISRKITNHTDRRRLRKIANELEVPEGMGLIIRTAGASRTKAEIKRDFEYLLRLWENVRDLTLQSTAPSLVYEEGSLIKRSIRDLYSKEIDEVLVAGDDAYREAKDFMRMLMPSHAKNVQPYKDPDPLFVRHRIERQLNSMFSPYVTLKSGGYIVINQTEALVSIDVNSGKATREHSIEDTALKTNLEAADEIARQLRLRDLAGLIVIDFIDMDERRNNRAVERKVKECMRNDRARIQIGRISHFGLLEMSRQRLRTGVLEGSTVQCPHCQGTGMMRSTESVALTVLRAMEDALLTGPPCNLSVTTSIEVALYILNQKRPYLKDIEARYGAQIAVQAEESLHGANFSVDRINRPNSGDKDAGSVVQMDWAHHEPHGDVNAREGQQDEEKKRSRRRRGGRGRSSNDSGTQSSDTAEAQTSVSETKEDSEERTEREGGRRPRRRGRRGGRRNRSAAARRQEESAENNDATASDDNSPANADVSQTDAAPQPQENDAPASAPEPNASQSPDGNDAQEAGTVESTETDTSADSEKPKRRRRRRSPSKQKSELESPDVMEAAAEAAPMATETNSGPAQEGDVMVADTPAKTSVEQPATSEQTTTDAPDVAASDKPSAKPRRGWWQRRA